MRIISRWHAKILSEFFDKLASTPEGANSLFDNSLSLWTSEMDYGPDHKSEDTPFIFGGSAGGKIATGKFKDYGNNVRQTQPIQTILSAFGLPSQKLGEYDDGKGPLVF